MKGPQEAEENIHHYFALATQRLNESFNLESNTRSFIPPESQNRILVG